jgi:sec-independent protein translocase protein TatB
MFGIGWGELLVVAVVALLILGPDKLPEAARSAGRLYGQLQRTLAEARAGLKAEMDLAALDREPNRYPAPPAAPETGPTPTDPAQPSQASNLSQSLKYD